MVFVFQGFDVSEQVLQCGKPSKKPCQIHPKFIILADGSYHKYLQNGFIKMGSSKTVLHVAGKWPQHGAANG
jgi:hypothetical protein